MSIQNMLGKYKGKRVAHVVDTTVDGKLCVVFGRLSKNKCLCANLSLFRFALWCVKHNAKKIKTYDKPFTLIKIEDAKS